MSSGIVICSECRREVHQYGPKTWEHCEDRSQACDGATPVYPTSTDEIAGKWCGRDQGPSDPLLPKGRKLLLARSAISAAAAAIASVTGGAGAPDIDEAFEKAPAPPTTEFVSNKPEERRKERTNRQPNPKRHARRRQAKASRRANR